MTAQTPTKTQKPQAAVALAVDFDGTFHLGEINVMGFWWLARTRPWLALWMLVLVAVRGNAAGKLALERWALALNWLPELQIDMRVVALMEAAKAEGRQVIIATGSPQAMVGEIVVRSGFDYPVLGTIEPGVNMIRGNKAAALTEIFGEKGFDYAGNSCDDLKVWPHARGAIVVNARPQVALAAQGEGNVLQVLPREGRAAE